MNQEKSKASVLTPVNELTNLLIIFKLFKFNKINT